MTFGRESDKKKNDVPSAQSDKMDTDEFSSDNETENAPVVLPLKVLVWIYN